MLIYKQTKYSYVIHVYEIDVYVIGLGFSYWKQVISTLRDIIPVYDKVNIVIAVSEIHRIIKKNGRFLIVDLGKPDNKIIRLGVSIYLKYIIKIFAYIIAKRAGLKFQTLYGTF